MRLFSAFLIFCYIATPALAADLRTLFANSLANRAPSLVTHFDDNVELSIEDVSEMYSESVAAELWQRFLSQESNWRYAFVHEAQTQEKLGGYAIVNLDGDAARYRIFIYYRNLSGSLVISELTINRK